MAKKPRSRKELYTYLKDREIKKTQAGNKEIQRLDEISPEKEYDQMQNQVDDMVGKEDARLDAKKEGHRQQAREDLSQDLGGMSPGRKQALEETANRQIQNHLGNYSRMLRSSAGASGIRGGAANALQDELQSQGMEARNQFLRDFRDKDEDVAMQKLAAYLSTIEGRTAGDILQRQQMQDWLTGQEDKRKQAQSGSSFNKYYKRV